MKRVIDKINEVLETRKNIGYIEIYYNNKEIGHFATKECLDEEGIETTNGMIFFKKNYIGAIKEVCEKIEKAKKITTDGDYYGNGFSGWLVEEIRFYGE